MEKLKIKMVVADFDGTLQRSDRTISKATTDAVKKYMGLGGKFLVATGRMHRSIAPRFAELGLNGLDIPVISYQGALVKTAISGKVLKNNPLDLDIALEILDYLNSQGVYYHTYIDDRLYVDTATRYTKLYSDYVGVTYNEVGDIAKYLKSRLNGEGGSCHKIISILPAEVMRGFRTRCNELFFGKAQFNSSTPRLLECVSIAAGKGNAVRLLADQFGIDMGSVMAIGDSLNDYSMVDCAGLGIAMGNADEELKSIADAITLTNDQDGVAYAMEKYCYARG